MRDLQSFDAVRNAPVLAAATGKVYLLDADLTTNLVSMMSTKPSTPDTLAWKTSAQPYVFCVLLTHDDDDVELIPVTAEDDLLLA